MYLHKIKFNMIPKSNNEKVLERNLLEDPSQRMTKQMKIMKGIICMQCIHRAAHITFLFSFNSDSIYIRGSTSKMIMLELFKCPCDGGDRIEGIIVESISLFVKLKCTLCVRCNILWVVQCCCWLKESMLFTTQTNLFNMFWPHYNSMYYPTTNLKIIIGKN
jgi:hypothetical protein